MDLLLADGIGRPAREIPAVPYFICLRRTSRGGFAMVSVKASRTFRPEKSRKIDKICSLQSSLLSEWLTFGETQSYMLH